jgi:hypothetical protein
MSVDLLLSRLEKVSRAGARNGVSNWLARCPAHKDRSPSLSIGQTTDGRVLVHCHAGCDVEAIVAAVGMRLEDLFPPRPAGTTDEHRPARVDKPWTTRALSQAFELQLYVAWELLAKVAGGSRLTVKDRQAAADCVVLCASLMAEISE